MDRIGTWTAAPSPSPSLLAPPRPREAPLSTPLFPAPYSAAALFRRLANGGYALSGRTGDDWDIARAPQWRSKSKLLDPFLVQASNVAGSLAFGLNVINNAGGRIFCDIPALVDTGLEKTLGVNSDELALIAQSSIPPSVMVGLSEIPLYYLSRAAKISRFGRKRLFKERLILVAKRLEHIEANHGWRNLNLSKSLFFPHVDKQELIRLADALPKIPQKGGRFAQIATSKEYVGLDCATGLPTKVYTVISDAWSKVVTLHPGPPDPKFALP